MSQREQVVYDLGMADERALRISLHYHGPAVEDGTMPVEDVLSALHGFTGAYGKVAARLTPQTEHRLRVSAINHESFELVLFALAVLGTPPNQQQLIQMALDAGAKVVSAIGWLIRAKKHIRGQRHTVSIKGDGNTVNLINADGATLDMPVEMYNLYEQKLADADLARIAKPLRKNEIDRAVIATKGFSEEIQEEISETDSSLFEESIETTVTTTKDTKVDGFLVSLNKERNHGTFRLRNGTPVSYDYRGQDPYSFYLDFSYKGLVRATGDVSLDENLVPTHIRITSTQRLQDSLPFGQDESSSPSSQT